MKSLKFFTAIVLFCVVLGGCKKDEELANKQFEGTFKGNCVSSMYVDNELASVDHFILSTTVTSGAYTDKIMFDQRYFATVSETSYNILNETIFQNFSGRLYEGVMNGYGSLLTNDFLIINWTLKFNVDGKIKTFIQTGTLERVK